MQALKDLEIGVMFWAGRDPVETLREVKALGVRCGQIGIPGDLPLAGAAAPGKPRSQAEDFTVVTAFCAYTGESYADIPTVQRTVGFIPPATRAEREQRTHAVSDFAPRPRGPRHRHAHRLRPRGSVPIRITWRCARLVRRVCDHAAKNKQTFALETGQEPAETLLQFFIGRGPRRTWASISIPPT